MASSVPWNIINYLDNYSEYKYQRLLSAWKPTWPDNLHRSDSQNSDHGEGVQGLLRSKERVSTSYGGAQWFFWAGMISASLWLWKCIDAQLFNLESWGILRRSFRSNVQWWGEVDRQQITCKDDRGWHSQEVYRTEKIKIFVRESNIKKFRYLLLFVTYRHILASSHCIS